MGTASPHSDFVFELAAHVRKYCDDALDRAGTTRLVRIAAEIATNRLQGRLWAAARVHETTIEQEAMSVVAPLFARKDSKPPLAVAMSEVVNADDITVYLGFQKVVVRAASQELFHRWDESDPVGARLWQSLKKSLRANSDLTLFPAVRPAWVTLASWRETDSTLARLNQIPAFGLADSSAIASGASFAKKIVRLLTKEEASQGSRYVLSIDDLFAVLREHVEQSMMDWLSASRVDSVPDPSLKKAVDMAAETTRKELGKRLDRYESDGKLPPEFVEKFRRALFDLLDDCADGGRAQSNYKYIVAHWPELTWEDYRKSYRPKFEYLADCAEDGFGTAFAKNYGL